MRAPSESGASSEEGGWLALLDRPVRPSRSLITASYAASFIRGIWDVVGTPGLQESAAVVVAPPLPDVPLLPPEVPPADAPAPPPNPDVVPLDLPPLPPLPEVVPPALPPAPPLAFPPVSLFWLVLPPDPEAGWDGIPSGTQPNINTDAMAVTLRERRMAPPHSQTKVTGIVVVKATTAKSPAQLPPPRPVHNGIRCV